LGHEINTLLVFPLVWVFVVQPEHPFNTFLCVVAVLVVVAISFQQENPFEAEEAEFGYFVHVLFFKGLPHR
jgi:hypothetical protein